MATIKNFGIVGIGSDVQLGKNGSRIVENNGKVEFRDAAGVDLVSIEVADATTDNGVVTFHQLNAAISALDSANVIAEVNQIELSVGLNTDGTYIVPVGTNYLDGTMSVMEGVINLDRELTLNIADAEFRLDNKIANTDAKVASLESNVTTLESGFAGLEEDVSAVEAGLVLVNANVATVAGEVDAVEAGLVLVNANVATLDGRVTTVEGEIDAVEAGLVLVNANVATVVSDLETLEGNVLLKDGSVALEGDLSAGNFKITNLADGTAASDAINKGQLDALVASLSNAFSYSGTIEGGLSGEPFDVSSLPNQVPGAYYKVIVSGYITTDAGATEIAVKTGDGVVRNIQNGWDIFDNNDPVVLGTAGQIAVTGDADIGYSVAIDPAYTAARQAEVQDVADDVATLEGRVTSVEGGLATFEDALDLVNANVTTLTGRVTSTESNVTTLQSNVVSLQSNVTTLQSDVDAVELLATGIVTGAGLDTDGSYVVNATSHYLQNATSLANADDLLDSKLKSLEDAIAVAASDKIISDNGLYSVQVSDADGIQFFGDVNGVSTEVGSFSVSDDTNTQIVFNVSVADEVEIVPAGAGADIDLRLSAKGAGKVIIGDQTGDSIISAETGNELILSGDNGVRVSSNTFTFETLSNDPALIIIGQTGADSHLLINHGAGGISLTADSTADDSSLNLRAKGAGTVDVGSFKITSVANATAATDAVNKGQLDYAVASTQSGKNASLVVTVNETDGTVNLGSINGTVTGLKVVTATPWAAGATINIGTASVATDLATVADFDETTAGIYQIDTVKTYANQTINAVVSGTTGSGGVIQVIVNYVIA